MTNRTPWQDSVSSDDTSAVMAAVFLDAPAPESLQSLPRAWGEQEPFSNRRAITRIALEIRDILERGDSMLEEAGRPISFNHNTLQRLFQTARALEALANNTASPVQKRDFIANAGACFDDILQFYEEKEKVAAAITGQLTADIEVQAQKEHDIELYAAPPERLTYNRRGNLKRPEVPSLTERRNEIEMDQEIRASMQEFKLSEADMRMMQGPSEEMQRLRQTFELASSDYSRNSRVMSGIRAMSASIAAIASALQTNTREVG